MSLSTPTLDVVCIVGGARSGTHLLNSLVCTSDRVPPLLPESMPMVEIARGYRATLDHLARFPGAYFASEDAVLQLYARSAAHLVSGLHRRYDADVCVFRSPMLTRFAVELHALLWAAGLNTRFLCMVRDPRDVVASMKVWNERRVKRSVKPLEGSEKGAAGLARFYWSFYPAILDERTPALARDAMFIRYEDLVASPLATAEAIHDLTGLELDPSGVESAWSRARLDYRSDDSRLSDALTPLFGRAISSDSVGRWEQQLEPAERKTALRLCRPLVERFYPELEEERGGAGLGHVHGAAPRVSELRALRRIARQLPELHQESAVLQEQTARYEELRRKLPRLRRAARRLPELEAELTKLQESAKRYDDLSRRLPKLRQTAKRLARVERELSEIQQQAARYEQTATELREAKRRARQVAAIEEQLPAIRAAGAHLERLAAELRTARGRARKAERLRQALAAETMPKQ